MRLNQYKNLVDCAVKLSNEPDKKCYLTTPRRDALEGILRMARFNEYDLTHWEFIDLFRYSNERKYKNG